MPFHEAEDAWEEGTMPLRVSPVIDEMADSIIIGVAIVLKEKDGFLFELQKPGKWKRGPDGVLEIGMSCIGGTVEDGESLEGALQREAMEEIGCGVAFDRSTHPFSMNPDGGVSPLMSGTVPDGVQFLWEGDDPGYVPGAKVAVYAGHAVGRAEPGDLAAIAILKPGLFEEFATESLTVADLTQRGGILRERTPVPRSARVEAVGTAARLLVLRNRHPDLLQHVLGKN